MSSEVDVAGQQLTDTEVAWLKVPAPILAQVKPIAAVVRHGQRAECRRCGAQFAVRTQMLPSGAIYCPECITMGRVTDASQLWRFPARKYPAVPVQMSWTGQLTPQQEVVAAELVQTYRERGQRLLWAVTGAGKTEMLFRVLAAALGDGEKVAVVSPRIDVILELAPRIAAAFTSVPLAVRYGESGPVPMTQLLLATVHQLLRYRHNFGLIVVDEVDAFPYNTEPLLERAVRNASSGAIIYLTATPGPSLLRQIKRGQLPASYLPRRFHGAPLPVPRVHLAKTPTVFGPQIRKLIAWVMARTSCMLLFVPAVAFLWPVQRALEQMGIASLTVHAAEPERAARVQALRQGKIRVLVTTTILERGVTFANCGVVVLQADAPIFSTAALVQMAGRAGRSKDHANDPVAFVCTNYTLSIHAAVRQIKMLNRKVVK